MNNSAARFIKPTVIHDLQQDKKSFSALDVSLLTLKDDVNLYIGLVTKLKLRKLMEQEIGNNQVDLFYDNVREFYT